MDQVIAFQKVLGELGEFNQATQLVVVSKTRTIGEIRPIYEVGHRDFGENKVQEMLEKYEGLPKDIRWHAIGHLQTNKVKYLAPFVSLIHSVDSSKLLLEIQRQALKFGRVIECLLQVKIAREETKFGLSEEALRALLDSLFLTSLSQVKVVGLMGMASNVQDPSLVREEFGRLKCLFDELSLDQGKGAEMRTLSMGMTNDYALALSCGSTMVRVGSAIFGERDNKV